MSDDSNYYDSGNPNSDAKIGAKKWVTPAERQRELRMKALNDPVYQAEHMQRMAEYRRQNEEMAAIVTEEKSLKTQERFRLEAEEKERMMTPKQKADRDEKIKNEKLRIEKIESKFNREKSEVIEVVDSFFNSSKSDFDEFIKNRHTISESPVYRIIEEVPFGYKCILHKEDKIIPIEPGRLATNSLTLGPMEQHIRLNPEEHRQAILKIIDQEFNAKLMEALEPRSFKEELQQIENIKTRVDGAPAATKRKT